MNIILAILNIVLINVILSGDNAIVIAMASKSIPKEQQKKAILWGTLGAVALRLALAFFIFFLINLPYVQAIGSVFLFWIAYKLLIEEEDFKHDKSGSSLLEAVKIIVVSDFIMSLDNVVAIAGAANGNFLLIFLGLAISIPLIIWGSNLIMKIMKRFPIITYIGSAILGWTGGEMFFSDKKVEGWIHNRSIELCTTFIIILLILFLGWIKNKKIKMKKD